MLTRIGAALGALMLFSFAFGAGQGLVPPGNALLMGALCVLFVVAPPGRVLGVDAVLRGRLPRWMVLGAAFGSTVRGMRKTPVVLGVLSMVFGGVQALMSGVGLATSRSPSR